MTSVKFLGTSDEVSTCDCCGRADLKSTVALSIDDGDAVYYGTTCAALALQMEVKAIRQGTKAADDAKAEAERAAREAAHRAEQAAWEAFLAQTGMRDWGGRVDVARAIEKLGGIAAARVAYKAARRG